MKSSVAPHQFWDLFQKVVADCPAYADFVSHIKPLSGISTFEEIPLTDKDEYYRKYPLEEKLYRGKAISDYYLICTSSGSTGEPTLWPRDLATDESLEQGHTQFLDSHFAITTKKTLVVIAFGLGTTTAGLLHSHLSWLAARKAPVTTITPGVEVEKAVHLIQALHPYFEQVVCIGYPPLIAEYVDEGLRQGLDVTKWNLKMAFAGAGVSWFWREELAAKLKTNPQHLVGFYGSSETGVIGFETPKSISLLREVAHDDELRASFAQEYEIQTLAEIQVTKKYVEIVDSEVVITVDQPVPLIRFNLHDKGVVLREQDLREKIKKTHPDLAAKLRGDAHFLAIFGRSSTRRLTKEAIASHLEKTALFPVLLDEFQYQEKSQKRIQLTFYLKKGVTTSASQRKQFVNELTEQIASLLKQTSQELEVSIEAFEKRRGYISGKLRFE